MLLRCSICGREQDAGGMIIGGDLNSSDPQGNNTQQASSSSPAHHYNHNLKEMMMQGGFAPPWPAGRDYYNEEFDGCEEADDASVSTGYCGGGSINGGKGLAPVSKQCVQALVERSLEFAGVTTATTCFGAARDECVAAIDSTASPSEEAAARLNLQDYAYSTPPPFAPSPVYGNGGCGSRSASASGSENDYAVGGLSELEGCLGGAPDDWTMEGGLKTPSRTPVADAMLPPEARPPWENAAAFSATLVVCERVLPSPRPAAGMSWRDNLRPRR